MHDIFMDNTNVVHLNMIIGVVMFLILQQIYIYIYLMSRFKYSCIVRTMHKALFDLIRTFYSSLEVDFFSKVNFFRVMTDIPKLVNDSKRVQYQYTKEL